MPLPTLGEAVWAVPAEAVAGQHEWVVELDNVAPSLRTESLWSKARADGLARPVMSMRSVEAIAQAVRGDESLETRATSQKLVLEQRHNPSTGADERRRSNPSQH